MAVARTNAVETRKRLVAARLRNGLDQKTGHEKQVVREYVVELDRDVRGVGSKSTKRGEGR